MKNKGSVFQGYFMSKNITPQIQELHKISEEKYTKFSAFHELVYEDATFPKS
ncbi:MAG: hypothetical protein R3B51_00845 [Thermodesulfobacteriota bacterium]